MAFAPTKPWKLPFITTWGGSPNRNLPTNSAEEAYFDTILAANPPERFSIKFLENLGFTGTNDRLLVGILKDLGFIDPDGTPQRRYFEFMDPSQSKVVLADAIRQAYAELFAINKKANELSAKEASNKLRT